MSLAETKSAVRRLSGLRLKQLTWALPLFFLIKGLLWIAVPALSAIYMMQ